MKNIAKIPAANYLHTFENSDSNPTDIPASNIQTIPKVSHSSSSTLPEADITGSVARLEYLEFSDAVMERRNATAIVTIRDLGELSESGESTCTSPVLTPVSSTTSLHILYTETELPSKLTITYSGPDLGISSESESPDAVSQSAPLTASGRANDKGDTLNSTSETAVGRTIETPIVVPNRKEAGRTRNGLFEPARYNIGRCETCCQGIHHWNPSEEIRKAQCRFERYGKKAPVMAVDEERGAIRVRPVAADTGSSSCQIRIKGEMKRAEPREEIPWRTWLASALTKICPARIDGIEREDTEMRTMPGGFGEPNCVEVMTPSPAAISSGL
jgi:hypothetical protein